MREHWKSACSRLALLALPRTGPYRCHSRPGASLSSKFGNNNAPPIGGTFGIQ
jgi:hypothetical protein